MDVAEFYRSGCTVSNPDTKWAHRNALVGAPEAETISYLSAATEQFDWQYLRLVCL